MKANAWFVHTAKSSSHMRLYCFPYAGGSAAAFAEWQSALDPAIEVWALQFPGRGSRFSEAPFRSMPALVEAMANAISSQDALPFAFFGHSLGALVAFEVACYCDRHGLSMPERLFASGCEAPQLRSPSKGLHLLSDDELISELEDFNATPPEVLRNRDLMELLLPMLRADFFLAETYQYHRRPPLKIPISVLAGKLDECATSQLLEGWQRETMHACDLRWFNGDHFFINQERGLVLDYLRTKMSEIVARAPGVARYARPSIPDQRARSAIPALQGRGDHLRECRYTDHGKGASF